MYEYNFDLNNNLSKLAVLTPNGSNTATYTYGADNLPITATFNSGKSLTNTFDNLGRLTNTSLNTTSAINTAYSYLASNKSGYTTSLVEKEENGDFAYKYEYDANGNITRISKKNGSTYTASEEYTYDSTGQLTQVDYLDLNKRCVYTYDRAGNFMKEKIYTLTDSGATLVNSKNYTYGDINWRDKLTKCGSSTITYDEIGNPLNYRDGISFTWSNGRQLQSYTKNNSTINYAYDNGGMRLSKTVDGTTHTYLYNSGLLMQETMGSRILDYFYDTHGQAIAVRYKSTANAAGTYYYYAYNSRGDIVGLYAENGSPECTYTYDPWGKLLSVKNPAGIEITSATYIGNLQSLKYRGYVYDNETGLYYLQSRYYDPVTRRFINADGLVSTCTGILGYNMFTYCENNPVNSIDPFGKWTIGLSFGAGINLFFGVSTSIGVYFDDKGNIDWQWSYAVPFVDGTASIGILDIGACFALQITKMDTVYDLYGPTTYIGGSGGTIWYVGADLVSCSKLSDLDNDAGFDGIQIVAGVGAGMDAHVTTTESKPVRYSSKAKSQSMGASRCNRVIMEK